MKKKYLTINEIAEAYGITRSSVYSWYQSGLVNSKKAGKLIYIEDAPIVRSLARKAQKRREAALLGLERRKTRKESDKYVNAKGEITDFWKWMKADSPLGFIVGV